MKLGFAIAALAVGMSANACLNDRDTIAFEKRNIDAITEFKKATDPEAKSRFAANIALKAIAGDFERYPNQYYEMRIKRLEAKDKLTAFEYDDLAVAYDRLGKVDTAIKVILDSRKARTTQDDNYRFHANYGTFLVHQWIVKGHKRADLDILRESIAEIEKALKINPDSHFGRENVQLRMEKDWLVSLTDRPKEKHPMYPEKLDGDHELVGLAGIAMMGLGYELPDIYDRMSSVLNAGESLYNLLSDHASDRENELRKEGKSFIVYPSPHSALTDAELKEFTPGTEYVELRAHGEKNHAARQAYVLARLAKGEHPDTHPEFLKDWQEPARPVSVPSADPQQLVSGRSELGIAGFVAMIIGIVAGLWWLVRLAISKRSA